MIALSLRYRADINAKDKDRYRPLSLAAQKGHKPLVKLLLAKDPRQTALHQASEKGHKVMARLLDLTDFIYKKVARSFEDRENPEIVISSASLCKHYKEALNFIK
ncbi:hypothetical protein K469DRAFT_707491 [Zopfia rhizophila CBS 207.26]|uniref:protein S-acyltransferase n=1 Tax=Zopfia rhizophila CBS 207.26 TaxID=1314779 RepID=A0A6A6E1M1_9PEZI|nr:hypothetical protein K469DRAFT_707491 [Zopfia rhizophila CBS 207.26]